MRSGSSAIPDQCHRLEVGSTWKIRFPSQGDPGCVVGRAYRALAGKILSALVPGQVEPCFIYLDRGSTDVRTCWDRSVVLRAGSQIWNARRLDLPRRRPVGGGVLVAQSAIQHPDATVPDHILAAANFAALRLEQLAGPDAGRIGSRARLTSRELAVLHLASTGRQTHDTAQALGLGEETVRSHLRKAQVKLGVRNRTHAACEALRKGLIP